MAIFKALFGEVIDCDTYLDISVADIISLTASKSDGTAALTIKPYRKIEKNRIAEAEKAVSAAVGVRVSIVCDETRTGFRTEFMDMVTAILKDRLVVANGFFSGAEYTLAGNSLEVNLKKGGRDILVSNGCDREIEKIIRAIFGFDCTVSFVQNEFDAESAVDSMQKKADEEIRRTANIAAAVSAQSLGYAERAYYKRGNSSLS